MHERGPDETPGEGLIAVPPLRGCEIELQPSRALVVAAADIALEDPAYHRYSNLPAQIGAGELATVRDRRVAAGEAAYWALVPPDRQIAGIFELWFRDRAARILEAGYWVLESARGKGYASQALSLVTDWVKREAVAERIELAIYPANKASTTVARRSGYVDRGQTTPSVPGAPREEFPQLYVWERPRD